MKQYFAFQWHITDACDQRCKHCYIFSENTCKKIESMSWEQMQETFDNCLDFCKVYGRLPYFYITGGDPILHPHFWQLLSLMKENRIPFTILGNPFHLTDEIGTRLKECGCEKYQLSKCFLRCAHGDYDVCAEGFPFCKRGLCGSSREYDAGSRCAGSWLLLYWAGLDGFCRPLRTGNLAEMGNPYRLLRGDAVTAGISAGGRYPSGI